MHRSRTKLLFYDVIKIKKNLEVKCQTVLLMEFKKIEKKLLTKMIEKYILKSVKILIRQRKQVTNLGKLPFSVFKNQNPITIRDPQSRFIMSWFVFQEQNVLLEIVRNSCHHKIFPLFCCIIVMQEASWPYSTQPSLHYWCAASFVRQQCRLAGD